MIEPDLDHLKALAVPSESKVGGITVMLTIEGVAAGSVAEVAMPLMSSVSAHPITCEFLEGVSPAAGFSGGLAWSERAPESLGLLLGPGEAR